MHQLIIHNGQTNVDYIEHFYTLTLFLQCTHSGKYTVRAAVSDSGRLEFRCGIRNRNLCSIAYIHYLLSHDMTLLLLHGLPDGI